MLRSDWAPYLEANAQSWRCRDGVRLRIALKLLSLTDGGFGARECVQFDPEVFFLFMVIVKISMVPVLIRTRFERSNLIHSRRMPL